MKTETKDYLLGAVTGIVIACAIAGCLAYAIQPSHNWCVNHPEMPECTERSLK